MLRYLLLALAVSACVIAQDLDDILAEDLEAEQFDSAPCRISACRPVCRAHKKIMPYGGLKIPYTQTHCVRNHACRNKNNACKRTLNTLMAQAKAAEHDLNIKARAAHGAHATRAAKAAAKVAAARELAAANRALAATRRLSQARQSEFGAVSRQTTSALHTYRSLNAKKGRARSAMNRAVASYNRAKAAHLRSVRKYKGAHSAAAAAEKAYNAAVRAHCTAQQRHASLVSRLGYHHLKQTKCGKYGGKFHAVHSVGRANTATRRRLHAATTRNNKHFASVSHNSRARNSRALRSAHAIRAAIARCPIKRCHPICRRVRHNRRVRQAYHVNVCKNVRRNRRVKQAYNARVCRRVRRTRRKTIAYWTNHCRTVRVNRRVALKYWTNHCHNRRRLSRRIAYYYTNHCRNIRRYRNRVYYTTHCRNVRRHRRVAYWRWHTRRGEEMLEEEANVDAATVDETDAASLAALEAAEKSDQSEEDAKDAKNPVADALVESDEEDENEPAEKAVEKVGSRRLLSEPAEEEDVDMTSSRRRRRGRRSRRRRRSSRRRNHRVRTRAYRNVPYNQRVCHRVRRVQRIPYNQRVCKRVRRHRWVNKRYNQRVCKRVQRTRYVNRPYNRRSCHRVRRHRAVTVPYYANVCKMHRRYRWVNRPYHQRVCHRHRRYRWVNRPYYKNHCTPNRPCLAHNTRCHALRARYGGKAGGVKWVMEGSGSLSACRGGNCGSSSGKTNCNKICAAQGKKCDQSAINSLTSTAKIHAAFAAAGFKCKINDMGCQTRYGGGHCASWGSPYLYNQGSYLSQGRCFFGSGTGKHVHASCGRNHADGNHRRLCPCK